jgi:hypothetical protein
MNQARQVLASILLVVAVSSAGAQENDGEIERIERAFIGADDLAIVNRIEDLPSDVIDRFEPLARWESMANWGELWSSGDAGFAGVKDRQHVYSAISDGVAAVLFQRGGITGARLYLLIAERGAPGICRYSLDEEIPDVMAFVREAMLSNTFWRDGSEITCSYQADQ